jgi:hypothetical protein
MLDLAYYYYPQYRWARTLVRLLPRYLTDREAVVVDAPCGDGVMSHWLLKSGRIANPFELYDRSPELIEKASLVGGRQAIRVRAAACDIFEIASAETRNDLWLLINSLYLLPDIHKLVAKMRPRFASIVAVFPYLDRANYRYYLRRADRCDNVSGMSDEETIDFFADHGYRLDHREDVTFLSQYRFDFRGARRIFNILDPLFAHVQGNYWIGVFLRQDQTEERAIS